MKHIPIKSYLKLLAFIFLLIFVVLSPRNLFDVIFSDMLYSIFGTNFLAYIAKLISYVLHDKILLLLMGLLAIFLFFIKEYQKSIFILTVAFFGASITLLIKSLISRVRPLPEVFDGGSFPSGHSVVVVLFFAALLFVINKKTKLNMIAKFSIVAIPFSRIMIGAHYPTDVIAGLLLGSVVVDLSKVYYVKIYAIFSNITGLEDGGFDEKK